MLFIIAMDVFNAMVAEAEHRHILIPLRGAVIIAQSFPLRG
jgi:hypothetical protein